MQATIPLSFDQFIKNYYKWDSLPKVLSDYMATIPGTSCCVQISHAFNMSGNDRVRITETFPHQRSNRSNAKLTIDGEDYFLILAVDEMENYLTDKWGKGESIHVNENQKRRSVQEMKTYLQNRRGIVVFRGPAFADWHAEPWNGKTNVQGTLMNIDACFMKPRVLFWNLGPPKWLEDFMATQ